MERRRTKSSTRAKRTSSEEGYKVQGTHASSAKDQPSRRTKAYAQNDQCVYTSILEMIHYIYTPATLSPETAPQPYPPASVAPSPRPHPHRPSRPPESHSLAHPHHHLLSRAPHPSAPATPRIPFSVPLQPPTRVPARSPRPAANRAGTRCRPPSRRPPQAVSLGTARAPAGAAQGRWLIWM